MPVYVYEDSSKLNCLCVLEDDGKVYDRPDSSYDSWNRTLLGHVEYEHKVYRGKDNYDGLGTADWQGYIYNDIKDTCSANRVGYVYKNEVYTEGPVVSGSPPLSRRLAYMEGDGDFVSAGAAVVLLVFSNGGNGSDSSSGSGGYYGGGYSATSCSEAFLPIIAVIVAIVGIVYSLMWIDGCSEKLEDDFEKENGSRVEEKQPASSVSSDPEGWMLLDDHSGRYRASFMNENANDTFTFTYTAGGDSTVSFEVDPDYRELKLSSYIIYNGQEYNIRTKLDVRAGDQVVVIVEQRAGTGYFNIYAYEN